MKTVALTKLRRKLAADTPVFGLWVTLESASITEMAVALGIDWVVIDAEHGHLDWKEIIEHIRAAVRSDTVVLVRVAEMERRADQTGARHRRGRRCGSLDGVGGAVAAGRRFCSVSSRRCARDRRRAGDLLGAMPGPAHAGSERARSGRADHRVGPGGRNLPSMLQVDGVEIFFLGPSDYSSSAGYRGQWEGPGVAQKMLEIKDAIRDAGKHCGVIATSNENLLERGRQGFRMIALGIDAGLLLRSLHGALAVAGRDQTIVPALTSQSEPPPVIPFERPPDSFRPDRVEVITAVGQGPTTEIGRGVVFECLVGKFNGSRRLTTGLVTFAPGGQLECHTHAYAEAVTLLSGSVILEVEGRRYVLGVLDNIVLPPGLAHAAVNASSSREAVLHIAMATDVPGRALVDKFFSRAMPDDSTGKEGAERVTRHRTAKRFEAGQGASFIDFFNRDLVPGIEMSGGYGLFQPGGRLLAHIHDFDESICIVQGQATCIVEGRKYTLSDCATALQPRGRVHYFINQSNDPMAMLWVYGGPVPERLIVAEPCCTAAGNPWK